MRLPGLSVRLSAEHYCHTLAVLKRLLRVLYGIQCVLVVYAGVSFAVCILLLVRGGLLARGGIMTWFAHGVAILEHRASVYNRVLSIYKQAVHQFCQVADLILEKAKLCFKFPSCASLRSGRIPIWQLLSIHPDQPDFQFWPSRYNLS